MPSYESLDAVCMRIHATYRWLVRCQLAMALILYTCVFIQQEQAVDDEAVAQF